MKENTINAIISTIVIGTVVIYISFSSLTKNYLGIIIFISGFLPWIPLKLSGRSIKSVGSDIIFGFIDTGMLGIGAILGGKFGGVIGAIIGGSVGDAITDAIAGIVEGKVSEILRNHGINEGRTPLSSSMGKMSGCLFGIGLVLTLFGNVI